MKNSKTLFKPRQRRNCPLCALLLKGAALINLTHRQRQVVELVADGQERGQIAQRLQIRRATVKKYMQRARRRLRSCGAAPRRIAWRPRRTRAFSLLSTDNV